MKFTKMQGAGNDYVYVNCFDETIENPSELAVKVSNRHYGIGSDGLVLIMPSEKADFRMRMFNADGSEAEMCGNASRCIGKYVFDNKLTAKTDITLETKAGIKRLKLFTENGIVKTVQVDMGEPVLQPSLIPVKAEGGKVINKPFEIGGKVYNLTCVSMGNPHAIMFVDKLPENSIEEVGKLIENAPVFPNRTNVEFVEVISPVNLSMRVWERGAGETLACGTGACAALVAAVLNGLANNKATIQLLGGNLDIEWNQTDNHVYMTGEAVTVFTGDFNI